MPKVVTNDKRRAAPEGWETIRPVLEELEAKMREAEKDPGDNKRKCEANWPIFRLHHQRSRYIYEMYYKKKAISRALYEWCLKEKWGDAQLIAKWKKNGYERLCCLRCIQTEASQFGSTCICRVPRKNQDMNKPIECANCGCRGCSSDTFSQKKDVDVEMLPEDQALQQRLEALKGKLTDTPTQPQQHTIPSDVPMHTHVPQPPTIPPPPATMAVPKPPAVPQVQQKDTTNQDAQTTTQDVHQAPTTHENETNVNQDADTEEKVDTREDNIAAHNAVADNVAADNTIEGRQRSADDGSVSDTETETESQSQETETETEEAA